MQEQANYVIAGGSGFLGSWLRPAILQAGHYVTVVTRNPERHREEEATNQKFIGWGKPLDRAMEEADVVINLAGRNLFTGRWTESVKQSIFNSRIESTRALVSSMERAISKPEIFISVSASGYYGDNGNRVVDESFPAGDDFLSSVCEAWESEALKAETAGIRVAIPRLGPVLQEDGGMLEKMKLPFQLFIGGPVGDGSQYIPWIHMDDLCRAILFPVENSRMEGPYNVCSPNPETMNRIADAMGNVLNRPSFFRVPEFMVRLALGDGAGPVLTSTRMKPEKLLLENFEFAFTDLEEALGDVL